MRIAVLANVRANLPALEAVLADEAVSEAHAIWCLGNFIGWGPFPCEVVDRLRQVEARCILGADELFFGGGVAVVEWADRIAAALPDERLDIALEFAGGDARTLTLEPLGLPLGIATNFTVNGRDVLVPMAIEEPSVVAAASHAALLVRQGGGFEAAADESVMIGQVQVLALPDDDLDGAAARVTAIRDEILQHANAQNPDLVSVGGGAREVEVRCLATTDVGPMLLVHLLVDVRDAMGANAVNTACEAVAPLIERATGGTVALRILSNLADRRLARAFCRLPI